MSRYLPDCLQLLYKKNIMLLEIVREERWQDFIELAESYILLINSVIDDFTSKIDADEMVMLREMVRLLQDNEREIAERLEKRLALLKEKMMILKKGKQFSQLYLLQ